MRRTDKSPFTIVYLTVVYAASGWLSIEFVIWVSSSIATAFGFS